MQRVQVVAEPAVGVRDHGRAAAEHGVAGEQRAVGHEVERQRVGGVAGRRDDVDRPGRRPRAGRRRRDPRRRAGAPGSSAATGARDARRERAAPSAWSGWPWVSRTSATRRPSTTASIASRCARSSGPGSTTTTRRRTGLGEHPGVGAVERHRRRVGGQHAGRRASVTAPADPRPAVAERQHAPAHARAPRARDAVGLAARAAAPPTSSTARVRSCTRCHSTVPSAAGERVRQQRARPSASRTAVERVGRRSRAARAARAWRAVGGSIAIRPAYASASASRRPPPRDAVGLAPERWRADLALGQRGGEEPGVEAAVLDLGRHPVRERHERRVVDHEPARREQVARTRDARSATSARSASVTIVGTAGVRPSASSGEQHPALLERLARRRGEQRGAGRRSRSGAATADEVGAPGERHARRRTPRRAPPG